VQKSVSTKKSAALTAFRSVTVMIAPKSVSAAKM
jgi:hypothetical protein